MFMAEFKYTAHDINGIERHGTLKAANPNAARSKVRSKGLFPIEITGITLKQPVKDNSRPRSGGLNMEIRLPAALSIVHPKQLMVVTRQMSALIHAGLPLLRGLTILERQEKHPALKKALHQIAESIEGGSTLADALALHPRIFNKLFINMVKAGEVGGRLDVVLERLSTYMEKAQRIKNKIKSAMTYPLVILLVSSAIMIFLMVAIIPKFEMIFSDLLEGRALPALTLFVMQSSGRIQKNWPVILASLPGLILLVAGLKRFHLGRLLIDSVKLGFPFFGNLTRMGLLARFARTLGTLMESGVPILQALSIAKETLNNEIVARAVQDMHKHIKAGSSLSAPVEAHRIFPPLFAGMVEVGEETGQLPSMLLKVADLYEEEVDHTVMALSSLIEPILIVILAGVVGTIVIALFLPMVSIIGNLS